MAAKLFVAVLAKRVLRWRAKAVRAYHLVCAREDLLSRRLTTPAGIWVCQRCRHVSFDLSRWLDHCVYAHATG